jgi:hypothetical protein
VLVTQVDPVGAQPPQRPFDRRADVGRAAVEGAGAAPDVGDEPELGGEHDLVTAAFEGPADELLVGVGAVDLSGVDEGSCAGYLRALAATEPDAPDLAQLVGELLVKSPDFARLWERYDIRGHSYGRKTFHHPDVGDLTLGYQVLQLVGTPGQHLITYYAEQGTAGHDALVLLDHLGANELASVPRGQSRR